MIYSYNIFDVHVGERRLASRLDPTVIIDEYCPLRCARWNGCVRVSVDAVFRRLSFAYWILNYSPERLRPVPLHSFFHMYGVTHKV